MPTKAPKIFWVILIVILTYVGLTLFSDFSNGTDKHKSASLKSTPQASFSSIGQEGFAPLTVQFKNTSDGEIDLAEWDFGDGNNSNEDSPFHTYTDAGNYSVALKVSGPGGFDTMGVTDLITVLPHLSDQTNHANKVLDNPKLSTSTPGQMPVETWGPGKDLHTGAVSRVSGTTIDLNGFLYLADYNTNYVHKFSSNGEFVGLIGGPSNTPSPGKLDGLVDVAVDSKGSIYLVEYRGHRVQKFDKDGAFLKFIGEFGVANKKSGFNHGKFNSPYGISIDSRDQIYVVDRGNHRIQKFDRNGDFITAWGANNGDGTPGQGPGEFNKPKHLAIDKHNNVYVADESNRRIQKFDSAGNFITMWGAFGRKPGKLRGPLEIAVDKNDNIYIVESLNHRIQVFDSVGNPIYLWNAPWTEEDKIKTVAVDGNGYVYITASATKRIMKLEPFPLN